MVINLGLHGGRIGSIFITGIFGIFYTKRGGIFDFQNGNSRWPCSTNYIIILFIRHIINLIINKYLFIIIIIYMVRDLLNLKQLTYGIDYLRKKITALHAFQKSLSLRICLLNCTLM